MSNSHPFVPRISSFRKAARCSTLRRAKTGLLTLSALAASVAFATPALAVTRYVDASTGANGANNCTVATTPCLTIAYAANQSFDGDVIVLTGNFAEYGVVLGAAVTVKGDGGGASIDAAGLGRHFRVKSSGEVRLENLTLIGGEISGGRGGSVQVTSGSLVVDGVVFDGNAANSGGAIACGGDCAGLTVLGSVLQFNSATGGGINDGYGGAIFSEADVTVRRTLLAGNDAHALGGGVYVTGLWPVVSNPHLLLTDSELDGNVAGSGGGVYAEYVATNVRRCSFIGNETSSVGGVAGGLGGSGERVEIVNSTFDGNGANFAGAVSADDLFLGNVTMINNWAVAGAADFTGDTVEMRNSIVSHPTLGGGFFQPSCAAWSTLLGTTNLLEKACDLPPGVGAPGAFWLNVLSAGSLGSFDYHGGETRTYELLAGSNAIDAGTSGCLGANGAPLPQDQRENPRPSGAACDIGAYER